ncbi:putative sulfate exporter family transporter [Colwellia sp. Arc7-D]|uniref:YeiH family protein n=1 Tax=Colwellia sp. Arc7-D TaxID=2161872 RepID=UPI000D3950AE|nr:putative sulfate exporter family transporter [Colwellia sp. Arc7-D]AWB58511.1 putative sulfate exporter family transporter [Colwellia sp. Arc7-D]
MLINIKAKILGVALCSIIAIIATIIATRYQAPIILFALLLGLSLHSFYNHSTIQAGVNFCSRELLRLCVGLLGVRIAFADIVSLGITPPLIVMVSMVLTIIFGVLFARILGLSKVFGVLSGGAVAVCGVSAAAAISTVLPNDKSQEKYFAFTVIGITTFSTLSMIFYPIVASYLGFSDELAGVFIGGAIHDVAQVVGAGYSISPEAGDVATYIKLLRVALLMPIVMMVFFVFKEKNSKMSGGVSAFIPGFLIMFFVLAFLKNVDVLPPWLIDIIRSLSSYLLVIAIAAIGVKTSLKQVLSVGWRPVALMASETLFLAGLIIMGIMFFY